MVRVLTLLVTELRTELTPGTKIGGRFVPADGGGVRVVAMFCTGPLPPKGSLIPWALIVGLGAEEFDLKVEPTGEGRCPGLWPGDALDPDAEAAPENWAEVGVDAL